jgi:hypothetical protein
MIKRGVTIVKHVGETPKAPGPVATGFGLTDPAEGGPALERIAHLGFIEFLIIQDMDGNLIEVQEQIWF